jgi:hypothetical protein
MKKYSIFVAAILIVSMLIMISPVAAHARSHLDIIWYANDDAAYAALKSDDIDFIQWSLTLEQLADAQLDPNLQVAQYVENGMFEFDLNNNDTIIDYPTSLNPMHVLAVRQAVAFMIDKDYIMTGILFGLGSRIDAAVCYPQFNPWVEPGVVTFDWNANGVIEPSEDNYLYNYDPDSAAALLAGAGFSDTDANGYLNYPDDPMWMDAQGIDTTLMPLKIVIRNDHGDRLSAGRYLVSQLEGSAAVPGDSPLANAVWPGGAVGGDFDTTDVVWEQPRAVTSPMVMGNRNYHIYTGGWSFGRFPTYQFSLFHSMFWYPYGASYCSSDEHPQYDVYLENIWYAPTLAYSQLASRNATKYHVENCVNIPLWSYTSYVGWRKELSGMINMKGYGIVNDYTFLNAYRAPVVWSGTIRMGCVSGPDRLNIIYSQWYFEYALLERVYHSLIAANPYNLESDTPWMCKDWVDDYWDDGGVTKSKAIYYLRHDAGCAEPVTGNLVDFFDAYDYEFTVWYMYAFDAGWNWAGFMDVRYTKVIDASTVEVYFDDESIWFKYAPIWPMLGPQEILIPLLCTQQQVVITAPAVGAETNMTNLDEDGYGLAVEGVVKVISATSDIDGALVEGSDYYIRAGYDKFSHNMFVNLAVTPGAQVTIDYWEAIDGAEAGIYLGSGIGLDWTDTMYSYGSHYPVAIEPSVGGFAAMDKNEWFFCSAPQLGEIDWRWYWDSPGGVNNHDLTQTHPIHGYFRIEILDVVRATAAYCHRGDGPFDIEYFAGADMDANDLCHVGILDLVTITGKYARTFCYQWYPDGYLELPPASPFAGDLAIVGVVTEVTVTHVKNADGVAVTITPTGLHVVGSKIAPGAAWICGYYIIGATNRAYAFKVYVLP